MTRPLISYSFVGGEIDRAFYARTDLEKYPAGVARAYNFTIDYRGGLKSRPGFEFLLPFPEFARMFIFPRGGDLNPFLILITEGALYIWEKDRLLDEDAIAVVSSDGAEIELADASGFSEGDLLYIGNALFRVSEAPSGDTITVDPLSNTLPLPVDPAEVHRVRSWANNYGPVCLPTLKAHFQLDELVITCNTRPPMRLVFKDDDFVFEPVSLQPVIDPPTGVTISTFRISGDGASRSASLTTGNAYGVFAVSAVDNDGNESLISRPQLKDSMYNYTAEPGSAIISWDPVPGAVRYRVYRSIITETSIDIATRMGFIGDTITPVFTDENFIPDYTLSPSELFAPFDNGVVLQINVIDGGSGYNANTTTISIGGDGSGFLGYPVIREGEIQSVLIMSGGKDYKLTDTVTVSGGDGSGASLEIESVTPEDGNYPAASTVAQTRRYYAGTPNLPLTFFASRIGQPNNFRAIAPPAPDDSFNFALSAEEIAPIRHMVRVRNGLLMMHRRGVDRLLGSDGGGISATSIQVETQSDIGVGRPDPAVVNDDILFSTPRGSAVIAMAYTFYSNSYSSQEISVLAPHLFGPGRAPVRFAWVPEPDKLLWVLREDGALLTLTYMKEQEIFAWAQHETEGLVVEICAAQEPDRDVLYALVSRSAGLQLEVLANRVITSIADYVGSDSAIVRRFDEPTTEVDGLELFEAREVSVLADGDAVQGVTVEDGRITVSTPARKFVIGIPYLCEGITLPLSNPEIIQDGVRRRIVGLAARIHETRGLEIGADERAIWEMKDRGHEDWDEVTALRFDNSYVSLSASWRRDAQIIFRQRYPLPAHILGYACEVEAER